MTPRYEIRLALTLPVCLLLALACLSCARRAAPPEIRAPESTLSGEPERYSAVVERRVEDGQEVRIIVTRVARAGDHWREEWDEGGERFALILRPDLGKSFLLNLDRQLYAESILAGQGAITPKQATEDNAREKSRDAGDTAPSASGTFVAHSAEKLFEEEPAAVEERTLSEERIDDHLCLVTERRATFADGRVEVTKIYRAPSLGGLALRTEAETLTQTQRAKTTTMRRNLSFDVTAAEFEVPAGFKRVRQLP